MQDGVVGSPPPPLGFNTSSGHARRGTMVAHTAFYWGTHAEVLFSGWPGKSPTMYALALVFVFALAALVEWLSHCKLVKPGANRVAAGFFRTAIHAVRAGATYMTVLALMSFNGGVFLAAVSGHAVGYLIFGSRVLEVESGLPTGKC
ncbi:copper transporter 1 [Diospyros lotus]|uniref:copper transporter 1 n=1 Tax=Diospyros lotus TaxID=55363 RepID=UPI0022522A6B|nr:copper transporter 1 [Diospyros lotus]